MATRQSVKTPTRKPATKKTAPRATGATATLRKKATGASAPKRESELILPVDQLRQLHQIKPDAVDWVIRQTEIEAEHRREETSRVNGFILVEHFLGQISALTIGVSGVLGGSWVAVNGQPWPGATIAGVTVAGLTVVYLAGKKRR